MERLIIFWCPRTGLDVQTMLNRIQDEDENKRYYESIVCSACSRVHFLNLKTGKLLGYEKTTPLVNRSMEVPGTSEPSARVAAAADDTASNQPPTTIPDAVGKILVSLPEAGRG